MSAVLTLALALQVTIRVGGGSETKADSTRRVRRDSIEVEIDERRRDRQRRAPRRITLTPELESSAFHDAGARDLLLRARVARLRLDSTLASYEATTYQRMSVGLGFRLIGRDRLLFRSENATRVRWSRDGGAWIDVTGQRTVFPAFRGTDSDADMDDISPLPYYPGRESLWIGSGLARTEVDDRELVHPIALGSEAYYRYSTGDSLVLTLPNGEKIRLRELRIEPRRPEWRLSVGSFWFDDVSGQLVRAVYRLAVPMDIWAVADEETRRARADTAAKAGDLADLNDDDVPRWVRGLMSPLSANLEAVTIEYGLYGTRFWLPRTQYAEGWARAGFMRVPFKIEESFKYGDVNGTTPIAPIPPSPKSIRDSLFPGDSGLWRDLPPDERRRRVRAITEAARERGRQDSVARKDECARTGSYTRLDQRYNGTVRVAVRIPCDSTVLANSPDLPASIYDAGTELFGERDRDELLKALDFSLQSAWAPQRPIITYGLPLTRYNRVEGFSTGIGATTELGRGYSVDAMARLGTGDWQPNGALGVARSNGRTIWRLGGFSELAVASEWGSPLTFGAGLGALLFGRDDGFYYRTGGLELERTSARGGGFTTRFFAEHHSPASVTTTFSLTSALGSSNRFGPNFDAVRGNAIGVAVRDIHSFGLDPESWRAFTDLRLEGGWFDPKDSTGGKSQPFGRAALDLTLSRGLGKRFATALTVGGGLAHEAPIQRHFFLGGTQTVRGQRPGTAVGDAYWLGRLELGSGFAGARRVIFGDIGWAGPHDQWNKPGKPMSGAGVGMSFFDGLVRADLARGIYPSKRFRFDLYFEANF